MNELLTFNESANKPTKDGLGYEPCLVNQVQINNSYALLLNCRDSESATACFNRINASVTSRVLFREKEFIKKYVIIDSTNLLIEGELPSILEELSIQGCITEKLENAIRGNENFVRLLSSEKTEGKLAAAIKAQDPQLWETLSTSPEQREILIQELQRDLLKQQTAGKVSPSVRVK